MPQRRSGRVRQKVNGNEWVHATRTVAARLEEPGAPLNFSAPPNIMSFPKATGQCTLHEPVAAEVVSVLDDLVPLLRMLLLGRTTERIHVVKMKISGAYRQIV